MQRITKGPWAQLLIVVVLAALLVAGCGNGDDTEWEGSNEPNGSNDTTEAPDIPPLSTFKMDFADFTDAGTAEAAALDGNSTKTNWNHAAWHVGVWNLLIVGGLAIPVAAFVECFQHDPVEQEDGSWLWAYNVTHGTDTYGAKLYGKFVGSNVHWDMYLTKAGVFEDFNWYSGICNLPVTEGNWTLRWKAEEAYDTLEAHNWIGIEWHRNVEDETGDIKYTNIVPDGPENGGYIAYGSTTNETYDAYYHIYNKGEGNLIQIEWKRPALEGRIINPNFWLFADEEWHYWNSEHYDIEAP